MALATLMPRPLQPLIPSAEGIAALLMNIFFATVGAAGARRGRSFPTPRECCCVKSCSTTGRTPFAAQGIRYLVLCTAAVTASLATSLHADAAPVRVAGSISAVIRTAPSLFIFCLVQIGLHLGIILTAGRVMGFSRRDVLLASNANVGGERLATLPKQVF